MWGSLIILTLFLGYWLNQAYDDAKQNMQEKNVLLFSQAVRATEDSLLHWTFNFNNFEQSEDGDTMINIHINMDTVFQRDLDFEKIASKSKIGGKVMMIEGDGVSMKKMNFIERESDNDLISTTAIIVRAIPDQKYPPESIDTFLIEQIEKHYRKAKELEFPGISYSMVHVSDSMQLSDQEWVTPAFVDPVADVRYAAMLDVGFNHIFSKIWPQFLFSLFLLGITGCAFYLIVRNLKRQYELTIIKDDFISNMTHELKTPISTVRVALEALESFKGLENPQRTKEYLNISQTELKRLQMLVDQVMNTGAIESADFRLHFEEVDAKEITKEVISAFQIKLEKENVDIQFHSDDKVLVKGDRLHLTNVIYNLIDNAVKYRNGSDVIEIDINRAVDSVKWSIRDGGVGIPKEKQHRIFDKFYRVPQGNMHNIKGHGLGLHYVHRIISLHGGEIHLESEVGSGSIFELTFPSQHK
jgi:two-component system phosphate regulon sensor histidine kinase PhoR